MEFLEADGKGDSGGDGGDYANTIDDDHQQEVHPETEEWFA